MPVRTNYLYLRAVYYDAALAVFCFNLFYIFEYPFHFPSETVKLDAGVGAEEEAQAKFFIFPCELVSKEKYKIFVESQR